MCMTTDMDHLYWATGRLRSRFTRAAAAQNGEKGWAEQVTAPNILCQDLYWCQ